MFIMVYKIISSLHEKQHFEVDSKTRVTYRGQTYDAPADAERGAESLSWRGTLELLVAPVTGVLVSIPVLIVYAMRAGVSCRNYGELTQTPNYWENWKGESCSELVRKPTTMLMSGKRVFGTALNPLMPADETYKVRRQK